MKTLALTTTAFLISLSIFSQIVPNERRSTSSLDEKNNIYLEFLGSGVSYSINYERLYKASRNVFFTTRVGTGFFEDYMTFPIHATALLGYFNGKIEIGGGLNLMFKNGFNDIDPAESGGGVFPQAIVGYRIQPNIKGLMCRVLFTPFLDQKRDDGSYFFLQESKFPVVPWGGFSLGYHF